MAHLNPHLKPYDDGGDGSNKKKSEPDPSSLVLPVSDPFEIDDFTAASDWEKFAAAVENVINGWGLNDDDRGANESEEDHVDDRNATWGPWQADRTSLTFFDFEFCVTWHRRERTGLRPGPPLPPPPIQKHCTFLSYEAKVKAEEEESENPVVYPEALRSLLSPAEDFPARAHPLHYFYGANSFICLTPQGREDVNNETRAKVRLLSLFLAGNYISIRSR